MVRIGYAGWSLPVGRLREASDAVQLTRYASVFNEASRPGAIPNALQVLRLLEADRPVNRVA